MKNPSLATWIGWLGATLLAALTLSAFAFTTFETKDESKEKKADIVQRLDDLKTEIHEINRKVDDIRRR